MLERGHFPETVAPQASDLKFIDLDWIFSLLRRQARYLVLCVAVMLALAAFYLSLAPRTYVSAAQILIDKNLQQVVDEEAQSVSAVDLESQVLNQIEIMRSSRLAIAVAQAENLMTDREFLNPPQSFSQRVKGLFAGLLSPILGTPSAEVPAPTATVDEVAGKLRANVQVERMGRSSIIRIGYEAGSPELAQRIAAAYANAFVQDQLNADLEATSAAADWMQQRLTEIGESQRQASLAIEDFRQQSGLSVGQDRTLTDQRIQALSSQLAQAQAETASIRAKSLQVQAVVAAGPENAANNVALLTNPDNTERSNDISAIRVQYTNLLGRIAEVTSSFGPDHPQLQVLAAEKTALNGQIFAQLQGLNDQYLTDLAIAEQRETALRRDIDREGQAVGAVSQAQVELNELQQRSSALNILYNSFLARYEESIQRQSFPIPAVRIITEALLPEQPSGPRTVIILAAAIIGGLFLGLGWATFNELRERGFRTGAQITRELGLKFLGYLPRLDIGGPAAERADAVHKALRGQILNRSGRSPTTPFLETLKSTRLALRSTARSGLGSVVGVVSALPGEGKTTFSLAFAEMLAASGHKVLLIDADLRRAAATELTEGKEFVGTDWRENARTDPETGLVTLPAAAGHGSADPLSSPSLERFLAESAKIFDFVVVDLPPLGPVVDAMSVLPWTDGFILVAEWGRTPRRLIQALFEREPQLADAVIGVVLNKVDLRTLPRYGATGGAERFVDVYRDYQVSTIR